MVNVLVKLFELLLGIFNVIFGAIIGSLIGSYLSWKQYKKSEYNNLLDRIYHVLFELKQFYSLFIDKKSDFEDRLSYNEFSTIEILNRFRIEIDKNMFFLKDKDLMLLEELFGNLSLGNNLSEYMHGEKIENYEAVGKHCEHAIEKIDSVINKFRDKRFF